jgi:hypothetical protein
MDLVDEQRLALVEIRGLLADFVEGRIEVPEFVPRYRSLFGQFDPPDLNARGLSDIERSELQVFIQIMGGWFGEEDGLIPRRPDWVYGTDTEPYSWIDGPGYRRWILERLGRAGVNLE